MAVYTELVKTVSICLLVLLLQNVLDVKSDEARDATLEKDVYSRNKRRFSSQWLKGGSRNVEAVNCHSPIELDDADVYATDGTWQDAKLQGQNAWISKDDDASIIVEYTSDFIVTGIQTQGDPATDQWVTSFTLKYSLNCGEYFYMITNHNGKERRFHGNRNNNTVVTNFLHPIVEARCLMVSPVGYHGQRKAMRLGILGCNRSRCFTERLGVDNNLQFSKSYFASNGPPISFRHSPSSARPRGQGWIPRDPENAWLQIKLPGEKIVYGLVVSGDVRGTRWVTSYTVSTSRNCIEFEHLTETDSEAGQVKVFTGPRYGNEKRKVSFPSPRSASCIRIHPLTSSPRGVALRVEILGCGTGIGILGGCGRKKQGIHRTKRVVGGDVSSQGQWPWLASMRQFRLAPICGAAIINHEWLVTAAHCVRRRAKGKDMSEPQHWSIRLGEHYIEYSEGTSYDAEIEKIIPHPDFDLAIKKNDIALIKLKRFIPFSDYINQICLPDVTDVISPGDECYVAGWGMLDYDFGGFSDILHHVSINVISNEQCHARYRDIKYNITSEMICAGTDIGGKDSCQGDSGGPLSCRQKDGAWVVAGVVSLGEGCGSTKHPGIYTRMTSFLDWMQAVIRSN